MSRTAAENLLAGPSGSPAYTPVPRYWSEQHGVRIQVAGRPMLGSDTVLLESPVSGTRPITGFVRDGGLVGLIGLDSPAAVLHWTAELARLRPAPSIVPPQRPPEPERPRHHSRAVAGYFIQTSGRRLIQTSSSRRRAAAGCSATISSADELAGRSRAGATRSEESPDSTGQGGC